MRIITTHRTGGWRVLAIALGLVLTVMSGATEPNAASANELSINAPREVIAGAETTIELHGVPDGDSSVVLVMSSGGSTQIDVPGAPGELRRFVLPPSIAAVAGVVTVIAYAAGSVATVDMVIKAGSVVGPIVSIVGARSIVADGSDLAMVVSIPTDSFGNPVATQTPFTFVRRHPDGTSTEIVTETSHLLAWAELASGTVSGSGDVWILSGTELSGDRLSGPRARLEEVAGVPRRFDLAALVSVFDVGLPADGRALTTVHTEQLIDVYGNVQPDGTQVVFEWVSDEGRSQATSETIAGVATVRIEAPSRPGVVVVQARARGVSSTPLALTFESAVNTYGVRATRGSARTQIDIGPITTVQGSLVADGTNVIVRIAQATRLDEYRGSTVDGVAVVSIPIKTAGSRFSVEVLGLVVEGTIR